MFGIGSWEFLIIAVLALLLFGPDKLPQFARTIGRFMRDFKRYQDLMESTLRAEIYSTESAPDAPFKRGKEYRKKVEAEAQARATEEPAVDAAATPSEGEPADDGTEAPVEPPTPAERAAALPAGHPLAAALAAGEDIGIDDDLDLSTLDPDDFGWAPGSDGPGEGVDGEDA